MSRINLVELLPYIDPAACSYEEWLQVGMGLQAEGFPLEAWDGWSQNDPQRYHLGECARKWAGFRGEPEPHHRSYHHPDGQSQWMAQPEKGIPRASMG